MRLHDPTSPDSPTPATSEPTTTKRRRRATQPTAGPAFTVGDDPAFADLAPDVQALLRLAPAPVVLACREILRTAPALVPLSETRRYGVPLGPRTWRRWHAAGKATLVLIGGGGKAVVPKGELVRAVLGIVA